MNIYCRFADKLMEYRLYKLKPLSGAKASIYSLISEDNIVLYNQFLTENVKDHREEIKFISTRLGVIGNYTGVRKNFLKEKEGKPGDGVCALFDEPEVHLRLYCIDYGNSLIIIGGGGFKSRTINSFQEDEKLKFENYLLREISSQITKKMKEGEIKIVGNDFIYDADLYFDVDLKNLK